MRKSVPGFLFLVVSCVLFGQMGERWIRITSNNCPVYSRVTKIQTEIIANVQRDEEYKIRIMDTNNPYGVPFYQIALNESQNGWIYGGDATLFFKDPDEADAQSHDATALKPAIQRLLKTYNDKTAELAVAYGLRSFPDFTLEMPEDSIRHSGSSTFELHLKCSQVDKKLYLKTADQLLFQLITHEVFDKYPYPIETLAIVITFGENANHTRLRISREAWQQVALSLPEVFWEQGVTSVDKNTLWSY